MKEIDLQVAAGAKEDKTQGKKENVDGGVCVVEGMRGMR